jgi:hypothetical protein
VSKPSRLIRHALTRVPLPPLAMASWHRHPVPHQYHASNIYERMEAMDTEIWVTDFFTLMEPYMNALDQDTCQMMLRTRDDWGEILATCLDTAYDTGHLTDDDARTAVSIMLNDTTGRYRRYTPSFRHLISEVTTKQAA